ncbi:MAG: discoidin domain-containing protein [Rubripirellula sp.]
MMISKALQKLSAASFALLLACSLRTPSTTAEEFFVSPAGSDLNAGTFDSPLASIAAAQARVRAFKQANTGEAVTVCLRGGKYYLTEPVVFTPNDSGTAEGPITYKAYKNEVPQVLGGVKLDNLKWEKSCDNVFKTKVPEGLVFETLFINGQQKILARYPNYTEDAPAFNGVASDCLSPQRVATWADPTDGYFHAMHPARWGGIHFQITGKKNEGEVTRVGGTQNNRGSGQHKEHRYVENIFEELDDVHEWYLNRDTSELYVYPAPDVELDSAEVEVAALEQLFVFKGTQKMPVQHISIEGLTLKRTIRTFMKTDVRLLRSDWTIYRGGVVHFEGTENCALKDSVLSDLGGNAVFFNLYNKQCTVEGCHIYNIGASGICFVGDIATAREENYNIGDAPDLEEMDFQRGPANKNYPQHCRVDNNLIYNIGTVEKQTAGVHISLAAYVTVSRNSIYDVPRAGINISEGKWGGHVLEYNDVFLTVQETHDHGAFNSWGRDRYYTKSRGEAGNRVAKHGYDLVKLDMLDKNVIRNNRWRCDHGWDIDLDDGSAWYEIYNNVCLSGGIKLRDGMLRTTYNNVMINNSMNLHVWLTNSGDVVTGNISTHGYFPIGMRNWGQEIDRNLFFQKESLETARSEYGTDKNSVYGDPGFADAEHGDYTVTNTNLADAIGWKNFPMDQFGVQKPSLKAIAKTPEFPRIELTADEVITGTEYMGGVIKNIQNDNEKSAAGLPDYKGAKIERGLTQGIFSVIKLQDDDVVLKMDDDPINNIGDFTSRIASGKRYQTLSVWRYQKLIVIDLPDPRTIPLLLPKKKWKVVSFDSEASGYEAKRAIDGDPRSFWHTKFEPSEPPFPHELVVDMGTESFLYSFDYFARQGSSHPRIKDFALFVSTDGRTWNEPVWKGKLKDTDDLQSFPINKTQARYFKLVGLSGYTRNAAAVGEISFYGTNASKTAEDASE